MLHAEAGSVCGPLRAPFIYVVKARDLVYIGETQSHPVMRWGAHLSAEGSFRARLAICGDPEIDYLRDVRFFAFHCTALATLYPPAQIKIATQAVEHALHVVLLCTPSLLSVPFRIISTTEKTAPRRFRGWNQADTLARSIAIHLGELAAFG